jgi:hypothetical protein
MVCANTNENGKSGFENELLLRHDVFRRGIVDNSNDQPFGMASV